MTAFELYESGRLAEAIQAALAEVKSKPTEVSARYLLVVLLCFNGELERADRQLTMLSTQHPETAIAAALLRQLIRAELCRQEFRTAGRLPEFTAPPSELVKLHLRASISLREGELQEAASLLAEAESQRPLVTGSCNGSGFTDFRDLDDLTSPFFEALTSTGKYYWIPVSDVNNLEFSEPKSLADLLWRPVQLTWRDAPAGAVYIPSLYMGSSQADNEAIRLGRRTNWLGDEQSPVRGQGLRMYLLGDNSISIMDIRRLELRVESDSNV